ncbi:hypothetical protein [Actinotalea sp.]|uniref:hypothetical protein n=1 Tax=Actinotalea sp. TaxID=1872145 RepID=UPI003564DA94
MPAAKGAKPQPMERTEEFDAFGPWVLPVSEADEVPRLFRPHAGDPHTAQAMLKVPRTISRRDANPSMDLYQHLLVFRDDIVVLLTRAPSQSGGVHRRTVAAKDLLAIEESVDLLDGRLVLTVRDGPALRVSYNGSSRDLIRGFVDTVRASWTTGVGGPGPERDPHPIPLGLRELGPDVALVTEYRALVAAEPAMHLLGAHPRERVEPVAPDAAGIVTRIGHRLWPMTLQGAIVCSDGRELVVLHRRPWWVRGARPVHSIARTMIPVDRANPFEILDHPDYHGVRTIRIGGVLELPVPLGSAGEQALREALG